MIENIPWISQWGIVKDSADESRRSRRFQQCHKKESRDPSRFSEWGEIKFSLRWIICFVSWSRNVGSVLISQCEVDLCDFLWCFLGQKQKSKDDKAKLCQELSCMVQDAHTALTDRRSSNAEQAFRRALVLMETTTPKVAWLRNWS